MKVEGKKYKHSKFFKRKKKDFYESESANIFWKILKYSILVKRPGDCHSWNPFPLKFFWAFVSKAAVNLGKYMKINHSENSEEVAVFSPSQYS